MRIRRMRFLYCEFAKKEIAIDFDEETIENGNGRDRVFETPIKCSLPKCPNINRGIGSLCG